MIPEDSYFLAAQHNTSTDEILFYESWNIPASHQEDFELLRTAITHYLKEVEDKPKQVKYANLFHRLNRL